MLRSFINSFGHLVRVLLGVLKVLSFLKIDIKESTNYTYQHFTNSMLIVFLTASSIGMVVSVQFGREIINNFGAANLIGGFVAMALIRELIPVLIAVVLSGSVAASITAEIGTMKITDQVDAMEIFRIDPFEFLLVPRFISVLVVGPLLTIWGVYISLFSGQIFSKYILYLDDNVFWDSVKLAIKESDLLMMFIKSLIFSFLIVCIATSNGINTTGGSPAVGKQTTNTVVCSFVAIFISNYLITLLF